LYQNGDPFQPLSSSSSSSSLPTSGSPSNNNNNNNSTTRLFYQNDESSMADCAVANTNEDDPLAETTSMPVVIKGTFGDIMSPSIDDADVLFRDGLVTSETYSLAKTYGISNPLDRMAVTANGNLQRLFSSYYDAPVIVEVEHCRRHHDHQQRNNTDDVEDTATPSNCYAVWNRRVLLKIFDQTFCTADSIIMVHSQDVEDLVESGKVGIGQLFRHFNILPEFALNSAGPTTNGGFWRNYTLESDLITCSIHEVFCSQVWNLSPLSSNEDQTCT
jgi:chorismate-pyruvate lyase